MAILPVNTQSGVDAALSMSQTGLNLRQSANVSLQNRERKLDIQRKMAEFEEWQSEDAQRYRSTVRKLEADSAQFMSENQDLINSGWAAEQNAKITQNLSQWADNESDILATVASPLMEASNFNEAKAIYADSVYPQLEKYLPGRQGAFSAPAIFDEEAWKKAQLTVLAATRNREQRQKLDLQNNQGAIQQRINKDEHDQQIKLAKWDTYSKLLLIDREYENKLNLAQVNGEPKTLDSLGISEDKLTHWQNSIIPKIEEDIRAIFPSADDDNLTSVAKAITSDVTQRVRELWDTAALKGEDPTIMMGSPAEVMGRMTREVLNPEKGYVYKEEGLFGGKVRYRPTGTMGRVAEQQAKIKAQQEAEKVAVDQIIEKYKGRPEFDAMSPKEQLRFATSAYKMSQSGRPAPSLPQPAPAKETSAAERQSSSLTGSLAPVGRAAVDLGFTAAETAFPSLRQ